MKVQQNIILYADEFKIDIWDQYMKILGLTENETTVKIIVSDAVRINR